MCFKISATCFESFQADTLFVNQSDRYCFVNRCAGGLCPTRPVVRLLSLLCRLLFHSYSTDCEKRVGAVIGERKRHVAETYTSPRDS